MRPGSDALALALLNPWQRGFPLVCRPFDTVAAACGLAPAEVLAGYARLQREGALSRIGAVFAPGAGGAALLCAMSVPAGRLDAVAALVSAHPGVNHNYAREHRFNLWFVLTGCDGQAVESALCALERATGLPALRLPMRRPYRIDLGFDFVHPPGQAAPHGPGRARATPVQAQDLGLAALAEDGLPLVPRPFDAWAEALGQPVDELLATVHGWVAGGTVSRFGAVVRHHELGWAANAMTVFDVPDEQVDAHGAALAAVPGLNLVYRRERAPGWPYNLFAMAHGRSREETLALVERATAAAGLGRAPRAVLFSTHRYKQTGGRRFRTTGSAMEATHALA
jgi:DNA-binding Lrp family transcriptional regulator